MKISSIIKKNLKVAALIVLFFTFIGPLSANSFSKYVGQSFILPIPRCPVSNGFVNSWSYSCSSTKINIINRGNKDPSEAVILSYFEGTLYIECFFQYIYYLNNLPYSGTRTEIHNVTCISNDISINAPRTTLKVGETMKMNYQFSTSTFDATPSITWTSNSNAIDINKNSGFVKAVAPGTATITAKSNLGSNVATCTINVLFVNPTGISITTTQSDLYCDDGLQLKASVYPSDASQSVAWSLVEGNETIATISGSGYLKGISPGKITVKAVTENGISDTKSFNVLEPSFLLSGTNPLDKANNVSVFIQPKAFFSHDLFEGNNYLSIKLKNTDTNNLVEGVVSKGERSIIFTPLKPLLAQTKYTFLIPINSVKNKWGTPNSSEIEVNFMTDTYEKLSISTSNDNKFLSKGDKIILSANISSAKIYYSLNGNVPTESSTLYTEPIIFDNDIQLRAIAIGDGYESSDVFSKDYYLTNVSVSKRYPDIDTKLYVYADVNPSLTYSNKIKPSNKIQEVTLFKNGIDAVAGEVIVADSTIFYIPFDPLELGCFYKLFVPQNAIVTSYGEENKEESWTFETRNYVTSIAKGNEISAALKKNGSVLAWGDMFQSGNSYDGSYSNDTKTTPETFIEGNVLSISAGYMHNACIKIDGSLWMWGRQYCGEIGNNSTMGIRIPAKIMEDVKSVSCGGQSTAIVKNDGTLWMVGRNDFGQLGDSTFITKTKPVNVMSDVVCASAGWCTSYAVKSDGTLFVWGRNDKGQVGDGTNINRTIPVEVMKDVKTVASSPFETFFSAAIKKDSTLWIWGGEIINPQMIASNVRSVSVADKKIEYVSTDGELYRYFDGSVSFIADSIADVCTSSISSLVMKTDGSVWNISGIQNEKLIDGRNSSALSGIVFNKASIQMTVGSKSIVPFRLVSDNADYSSLIWESDNENVITVSNRGVIQAHKTGNAIVTATICDNNDICYSANCIIQVGDSDDSNMNVDVNSDGRISVLDIVKLLYIIQNKDYLQSADVDGDGEVTFTDVSVLVDFLLDKEPK